MWRRSILIVDDVEVNREMLRRIISRYNTYTACNGKEALEILDKHMNEIDCILLDLYMPEMTGMEFLEIRESNPRLKRIPVIIITGDDSVETKLSAYERYGISDYIGKPFEGILVRARVNNVVKLHKYEKKLEKTVEYQVKQLQEMNFALIESLSDIVESRNLESGMHVKRVRRFAETIAMYVMDNFPEYGLTPEHVEAISVTSALHDIGKIKVPDAILTKPGKLSPEEFAMMKLHTIYGSTIIEKSVNFQNNIFSQYAHEIVRSHHERYDGGGYPDGLVGDDIPISAQICGIADCFDALVSERAYKTAFDYDTAYRMIISGECGKFSDKMLKAFIDCKELICNLADSLKENEDLYY